MTKQVYSSLHPSKRLEIALERNHTDVAKNKDGSKRPSGPSLRAQALWFYNPSRLIEEMLSELNNL